MTQQVRTYRERSREYLAKAFEELEAGDLTQASEKGWGAAAQIVKAVADERGTEHRQHRHLFPVVEALAREASDTELTRLFHVANGLHSNFYEEWLSHASVEEGLKDVAQFAARLERLLPSTA
jgi:hypothetical protein